MLLYKYLDAEGAAAMLCNGNIQFTNAQHLNDPFDCHPSLIDFEKPTPQECAGWPEDIAIEINTEPYRRNREEAWICCLSKVNNSLPMWTSYAQKHQGVCIGLDKAKMQKSTKDRYLGNMAFNDCWDVEYRDITEKPRFKKGYDYFMYQILTKSKEWAYEQEVRMFIFEPVSWIMRMPRKPRKGEVPHWKELRAYPEIDNDCFAAVYLGMNILPRHKKRIIEIAKDRNPDIQIYQMKINPDALRLDYVEVD